METLMNIQNLRQYRNKLYVIAVAAVTLFFVFTGLYEHYEISSINTVGFIALVALIAICMFAGYFGSIKSLEIEDLLSEKKKKIKGLAKPVKYKWVLTSRVVFRGKPYTFITQLVFKSERNELRKSNEQAPEKLRELGECWIGQELLSFEAAASKRRVQYPSITTFAQEFKRTIEHKFFAQFREIGSVSISQWPTE